MAGRDETRQNRRNARCRRASQNSLVGIVCYRTDTSLTNSGHQIGSSLSIFRIYQSLGVRYLTLTHTCNNALGDTCAGSELSNRWNGLSSFGRTAVKELNRLGMMVDISHVSPKTASDALSESKAPVIFSHSNARGVHSVARNIPDSILRRIGRIDSQREFNLSRDGEKGLGWGADNGEVNLPIPGGDAWIGLNFAPEFISEFPEGKGTRANVSLVAGKFSCSLFPFDRAHCAFSRRSR